MKSIRLFALIGLLSIGVAQAPTKLIVKAKNEIVVAAWNINMDPVGERLEHLGRGIEALDPDIIALTELTPLKDRDLIIKELGKRGMKFSSTFAEDRKQQNIVVFAREGVQITDVKPIPGSNDGNKDLRSAYSGRVKVGDFDFLLIAVHNKSKRAREGLEDTVNIRNRQTAAIWKFIEANTKKDKDVMVIGDYNMKPVEDDANFKSLNPKGFLEVLSKPSAKNPYTYIFSDGTTSYIDGFSITKGMKNYVRDSFTCVKLNEFFGKDNVWFRQNVTDHIPVAARFRVKR